jgi:LSD1 subclass zinc finger protein
VFLPIRASDWVCPAGHRRELMDEEGSRRVRCPICEGYDGALLTEFDYEFLNYAGVQVEAD